MVRLSPFSDMQRQPRVPPAADGNDLQRRLLGSSRLARASLRPHWCDLKPIFLDKNILQKEYKGMLETFAALADANRLKIFEALRSGAQPVGELADRLKLRQPQVSKHLAVLKAAGLVGVEPVAQRRLYHIRPEGLQHLDSWLDGYRKFWAQRFSQLDCALADIIENEAKTDGIE